MDNADDAADGGNCSAVCRIAVSMSSVGGSFAGIGDDGDVSAGCSDEAMTGQLL